MSMRKSKGRIPIVVYSGTNPEMQGRVWVRQRSGDEIIRGYQRRGIRAKNLSAEAVIANERTSPRVEIPRVVIETMRVESNRLTASDTAVFFRLFAHARLHGMANETQSIRISELQHYLGFRSVKRVRDSLKRLGSAEASYHFNQPGARGRIRVPMLDVRHIGRDLGGRDEVCFSFPEELRIAVLESRDYAWVDLNALARFESKFTAPIYLKLCWLAGLSRAEWRNWTVSRNGVRELLRMPGNIRANVFEATMKLVQTDLERIDGPRKRFDVEMLRPTGDLDTLEFSVTSSKRTLKEVRPRRLSDSEYEQIADRRVLPLEQHQYPSVVSLRQAATLAGVAFPGITVYKVSDLWKTDVWGAVHHGLPVSGMTADEFLMMIKTDGADDTLGHWVERRDFGAPVTVKPVPKEPERPQPPSAPISVGAFVPAEVYYDDDRGEDDDDLRMGSDFGEFQKFGFDSDEPPDHFLDLDTDFDEAA